MITTAAISWSIGILPPNVVHTRDTLSLTTAGLMNTIAFIQMLPLILRYLLPYMNG